MVSDLPYEISLGLALEGKGAPDRKVYDAALSEAAAALSDLVSAKEPLELLAILDREDDLAAAEILAARFADASEVFILGIGGSSLGGHALSALSTVAPGRPRLRFFDNLDPHSFENALRHAELKSTKFVAISKSGTTPETLMETLRAADAIRAAGGNHLANHFAVVTETKPSPLRQFAEETGCPILDHPAGIGGRYSVLSVVGLFPAILMGLDARAIRAGAKRVVDDARHAPRHASAAEGAALHAALLVKNALRECVFWAYSDRLALFGAWWRQLWAESLGKDGKGMIPVAALGPQDQHSQLQLFLDGPGAALFTLVDVAADSAAISRDDAERLGLSYLAGYSLNDLVMAEARATAETLSAKGRPVRRISLKAMDERVFGALFMHFMLETILIARLMGVDPFDQPAVEEGKRLARRYLEGKSR